MTDQDYEAMNDKNGAAGAPLPFPKAPEVKASLLDEAVPMLFASDLSYTLTDTVKLHNDGEFTLTIPEEFQEKNLERFRNDTWDLTEYHGGNGLSLAEILVFVEENADVLEKNIPQAFKRNMPQRLRDHFGKKGGDLSKMFLTFNRNENAEYGLVYAIMKDTVNKQVIVTFRGSKGPLSNRDWATNINCFIKKLWTPDKIVHRMEGRLKKRLLVHRGFYNYLFDNRFEKGNQPYDKLIRDLRLVLKDQEGYSVYVTGHSLGGALATMCAFKIAGAGKSLDFLPRPINCITYASPYVGTAGFRTAFENMERDGLIRCLRVNNDNDFVPAILPFSYFRPKLMKHVGINLRLTESDCLIEHSSRSNFSTALRNSMFKPFWKVLHFHDMELHYARMCHNKEELEKVTLNELYKDPKIMGQNFLDGKPL